MIKLVDVRKQYKAGEDIIEILHGVSLEVKEGELVAIMGPSGSGKSTIMNIIGLLDWKFSGDYYLGDKKIAGLYDAELASIRNREIGFVFQSFFLLPNFTAAQNVALPLIYAGVSANERKERALAALNKIGMQHLADRRPHEMSGGQQQRVAIARSLIADPKVVLADEPTGALDSKTSQEIMDLIKALNKNDKKTIIIVTHDLKVGKQCDRIIFVKDGDITDKLEEF
ncbi:MAG: ABC transporter ATP-binding protein [Gammaproteobacteria bacterium]|nr:ABC transporter ATP-binding protein [Gammaproteobacteria bacterium]